MRLKRSIRFLSTAAAITAFTLTGAVVQTGSVSHAASPAAPSGAAATSGPLVEPQADLTAYWTPQAMESATPATPGISAAPAPQGPSQVLGPSGPAGSVPPAAPGRGTVARPTRVTAPVTVAGPEPAGYSYPFPFTRYENFADYTQYPYSTEGKVFFTDSRTGANYVCSGSALNSTNLSVVYTAGHCVAQGGSGPNTNWYTNWVFCPAYRDGTCPLGMWTSRQLWSWTLWTSNGWFEYDFGAAVMNLNPDGSGTTLVDTVGGEGLAWNYPRDQHWFDFGYPQAAPFDGNRMDICAASHAVDDKPDPAAADAAMGIGCDMTGGSSGGGWFMRWSSNGGYRNGQNDYKYGSQPNAMYSPYYGDAAYGVFNSAQTS